MTITARSHMTTHTHRAFLAHGTLNTVAVDTGTNESSRFYRTPRTPSAVITNRHASLGDIEGAKATRRARTPDLDRLVTRRVVTRFAQPGPRLGAVRPPGTSVTWLTHSTAIPDRQRPSRRAPRRLTPSARSGSARRSAATESITRSVTRLVRRNAGSEPSRH